MTSTEGTPTGALPGTIAGPPGFPDVVLVEEGMREGLQIEDAGVPVKDKIRLLDALSATGLRRIVVGSFVSPKWTPQMAGIDEIVEGFTPAPGVTYTALALNSRGVERRATYIPDKLSLEDERPFTRVHLCDVFARRNTNRSQQQEIDTWPGIVERAAADGVTEAEMGVNAAWGSNWLGPFGHEQRMELLERQYAMWTDHGIAVTKVFLGDPMGWNLPHHVEADLRAIQERWPSVSTFHLHLHNTRGMAPISAYSALRTVGERCTVILDASIGGMAGCPYCGNGRAAALTPTEDLVHLLDGLGFDTGVDLDKLIETVAVAEEILGHRLYGHVSKAGGCPQGDALYPMDLPFIETLEQAQHFRLGPPSYEGAMSPWKEPITSPFRKDSITPRKDGA
ncbi:citramalate synthase [Pseudonocardia alaniniphila]|uniref:Citramalate synthase n=1 Tax=Pseudonocardia alaniniphila TaxID=75291 RepID=A0ABS9TNQ9_9PSEU|nr:citramalate synthase [Pseudonocardia alaniniphila]MCH6170164.1 citramalate synthase [Pseudonocardia alaniniphila]